MRSYFESFPIISYANTATRDITRRAVVAISALSDPRARSPLQLRDGTRADTVATKYYGDGAATWLVYYSAMIVDPTWGWLLDDDKLAALAVMRYGSVAEAKQRVRRYVTNWPSDTRELTPAGWASLADEERQYWEPTFGVGGQIVSYVRRQDDWSVTTNMIVYLTASAANGTFEVDERAQFMSGNTALGNCQICFANSTVAYVQHVTGNTSTTGSVLTGLASNATLTVATSNVVLQNIDAAVASYWVPEYQWDWLAYENQKKRDVRLVDARYLDEARQELLTLLNE